MTRYDALQVHLELRADQADAELARTAKAIAGWREAAERNGVRSSELSRFEQSFDAGLAALADAAAPTATTVPL